MSASKRRPDPEPEKCDGVLAWIQCRVVDQLQAGSDGEILSQLETVEQFAAGLLVTSPRTNHLRGCESRIFCEKSLAS